MRKIHKILAAGTILSSAASVATADGQTVPDAPPFSAQVAYELVPGNSIWSYRAIDGYGEPAWVTAMVEAGKLPAVAERLPLEPLVFNSADSVDGIGEYGGVLRHVIGGRPQGWNWNAGQTQGWGGITYTLSECLTRTGPLYRVTPENLEPLPNLATGWSWSDDGKQLTMSLIEGAKWSDGDPFDADDVMFLWEDNILDPNVAAGGGATQDTFGFGTTLEKVDAYTVKWTFEEAFPTQVLYEMGFGKMCPGPSHILKTAHPKYSEGSTYQEYVNAFPPEMLNFPTMGSHAATMYRPDDIVVLRRNPYYWKVDGEGNQLPYMDEMHFKLSDWGDRTVQAVAGSGDWSNLENPQNYVEALRQSAEEGAPASLQFGARNIGYNIYLNYSDTTGWGEPDARALAVRELNRNLDFRLGVTKALDRLSIGQSLVKGPFAAIYPGGLLPASPFYDQDSTVYFEYNLDESK
ncbi:UNVERIFIED_CONTAM: hypothetical protein GTU68_030760, partial [Idotea baltica]|nr:hypothetical protein [Idotea baltica]